MKERDRIVNESRLLNKFFLPLCALLVQIDHATFSEIFEASQTNKMRRVGHFHRAFYASLRLMLVAHRCCSCSFSTTARSCMSANMRRIVLASSAPSKPKGLLVFPIFFALRWIALIVRLILREGCSRSCTVHKIERTKNLTLMPTLIRALRQAICQPLVICNLSIWLFFY
jgi:hypothetical protein